MTAAAKLAELRRVVESCTPEQLHAFVLTLDPTDAALVEGVLGEINGRRSYRDSPSRFVRECIEFPAGEEPAPYQLDILDALVEHRRVAVRATRGVGKTAVLAWLVLWFALTRDPDDWKIVTTAGNDRQLRRFLWPEIRMWSQRLRWDRLGRKPFRYKRELLDMGIKLEGGEASAVAADTPAGMEGAHASSLLVIFDEAKEIIAGVFDAAEGYFSTARTKPGKEVFGIAASTPGPAAGTFYDIHARKPGKENWHPIHVKVEDAVAAGRIDPEWIAERERDWGRDSAAFQNQVLAEFADSDQRSIIPLAWIEAANERWYAWRDDPGAGGYVTAVGVDVARFGTDKTVYALRCGPAVARLEVHAKIETTTIAGHLKGINARWPKAVFVIDDGGGYGAGPVDQMREWNAPVIAFNGGTRAEVKDRTGMYGFPNSRSAAWWRLRELLDPAYGAEVALPPDPELTGDLTTPKFEPTSAGQLKLESKVDFKKRLGRSPDKGDAVVMAFWADMAGGTFVEALPGHRRSDEPDVLTQQF